MKMDKNLEKSNQISTGEFGFVWDKKKGALVMKTIKRAETKTSKIKSEPYKIINNKLPPTNLKLESKTFSEEFDLHEIIGIGSFGIVQICTNKNSGDKFAVKISNHIDTLFNLTEEMKILKEIDHPNIVKFIKFYISAPEAHLVIGLVEGNSLDKHFIKQNLLSTNDTKLILRDLLVGLQYLHEKKIAHRDIHPGNVLLKIQNDKITSAVLTDFGMAAKGEFFVEMIGTTMYSAPELIFHHLYNHKVDIFSTGMILQDMIIYSETRLIPSILSRLMYKDLLLSKGMHLSLLMTLPPKERISVKDALAHPWFRE